MAKEHGQWELADEIIAAGKGHPSIVAVRAEMELLELALAEARVAGDNLKRVGAGRTEHPAIVLSRVVPCLRSLSEAAALVASQLEERLSP